MSKQGELDRLNMEVTSAIVEMEAAARKVSNIEEKIANLTDPHSVEGKVARRGAVQAALAGRDDERARELVTRYRSEARDDIPFQNSLVKLFRVLTE